MAEKSGKQSEAGTKRCSRCHEYKSLDEFYSNRAQPDGYDNQCKKCRQHYRENNREHIRALQRQRYAENAEYRQRKRQYLKKWRTAHRDEMIVYLRQWQEDNKDKVLAWRQEHKEETREKNRNYHNTHKEAIQARKRANHRKYPHKTRVGTRHYRARKAAARGSFTEDEFQALCQHYEHRCLSCGKETGRLEADHVIPLVKGGDDFIDNIQPLCKSCNCRKGTQIIDYRVPKNNDGQQKKEAKNAKE